MHNLIKYFGRNVSNFQSIKSSVMCPLIPRAQQGTKKAYRDFDGVIILNINQDGNSRLPVDFYDRIIYLNPWPKYLVSCNIILPTHGLPQRALDVCVGINVGKCVRMHACVYFYIINVCCEYAHVLCLRNNIWSVVTFTIRRRQRT